MMHHTNTLRRFWVALGVSRREKYEKNYEFFKEKEKKKMYHCENIFFFSTSKFLRKHGTEIFLFPPHPADNVYFMCT
jgi:hypothetical protein